MDDVNLCLELGFAAMANSLTSSTCLTQNVTATHDFVVTNFSLLEGRGVGWYVSSSTFSVGGSDWNIVLYPDGAWAEGHASVYLWFVQGPENTKVQFSLSLFGKDEQASRKKGKQKKKRKTVKVMRESQCTFKNTEEILIGTSGWDDFIDKSMLRELLLGSNDCFTIRCVLTVPTSARTVDAATIVGTVKTLPDTSSACSSQSITVTHDFVVNDFSQFDVMGCGQFVNSGTFSVGDTDWIIRFYPDGTETPDHVSILLSFLRGPNYTRTKFSCSLLLEDYQASREEQGVNNEQETIHNTIETKECIKHTFQSTNSVWWGWPRFILKSKLREMLQASNADSFTIRCVLTVLTVRTEDAETIVVPPSDLQQDLARMLRDADGKDLTINVGNRLFLAHKHVLKTRCRVLKDQLFGVKKDGNTECLRIEDMEPSVFERLLHFIYTDSLSDNFEGDKCVAMMHLLAAADRYGLSRLGLMCKEKLRSWIDVQSVATILGLADQHHREQLKQACLGFIARLNVFGAVMETESFKDLIASDAMIMKEILKKIASAAKLD
ncbi:unnamed protein product [Urochloa humidicola]